MTSKSNTAQSPLFPAFIYETNFEAQIHSISDCINIEMPNALWQLGAALTPSDAYMRLPTNMGEVMFYTTNMGEVMFYTSAKWAWP